MLVPTNDVNSLAKAMEYLAENKKIATKLGNNANKIGKELNCEIINKKWIDYILKIERE